MAVFTNISAEPANPQILEARFRYTIEWEDTLLRHCFAIFHYHRSAGSGLPNYVDLGDDVNTNIVLPYGALLNERVTIVGNDIRPLDDPTVMPTFTPAGIGAGTITGDPLPANVALVINKLTGVRGRNYQGRSHVSGLSEADITDGDELNSGAGTAWDSASGLADNQLDDSLGNVFVPCVLSPTLSGIFQTPPFFTGADVTSFLVNRILGTMRKRREKGPVS